LGSPAAQASTMRARNAKAWAVVRRLAKLRRESSSAALNVRTDKGRPMISAPQNKIMNLMRISDSEH
jgi:hypothetical protein